MIAQEYWNQIGSEKDFEDPLYLEKISAYLTPNSKILEYGCGYGRILEILHAHGYHNLIGFDFAPRMIARGKALYPHLDMHLVENGLPLPDKSVDTVIMSTVLCCMVEDAKQKEIITELRRVLKYSGILYLSDFLISDEARYTEKYAAGFDKFGIHGIYQTSENLIVRHLTATHVMDLLRDFDIQWFEQFDFKTMNNNPARTFHCVAKKVKHR